MIIIAFLLGGIVGIFGAIITILFTDQGWAMAVVVYFVAGYGVPLAILAATSVSKPEQTDLPQADMIRR